MNSKNVNNYENVVIRKEQEIGINNFGLEYLVSLEQEIERLNNILDTLMQDMALLNATSKKEIKPKYVFDRIATLRGVDKE